MDVPGPIAGKLLDRTSAIRKRKVQQKATGIWQWKMQPSTPGRQDAQRGRCASSHRRQQGPTHRRHPHRSQDLWRRRSAESSGEKQLREGWGRARVFMNDWIKKHRSGDLDACRQAKGPRMEGGEALEGRATRGRSGRSPGPATSRGGAGRGRRPVGGAGIATTVPPAPPPPGRRHPASWSACHRCCPPGDRRPGCPAFRASRVRTPSVWRAVGKPVGGSG